MPRIEIIASLPRQLRQKPNSRLENGGLAGALIRRLTSFPTVLFLLKAILERLRIPKQNLSKQNTGAFLTVQRSQASHHPVPRLIDATTALDSRTDLQQIPSALASRLGGTANAPKVANFRTEARKSSSPDPPELTPVRPNPTESDRFRPNGHFCASPAHHMR